MYSIDIDAVHDPALAFLLRDKRKELDIQLDMLNERGSEDFLYSSIRLYKTIDEDLLQLARLILEEVPVRKVEPGSYSAQQFAERVEQEFDYFQQQNPEFQTKIHFGSTIPGLMVSRGELVHSRFISTTESPSRGTDSARSGHPRTYLLQRCPAAHTVTTIRVADYDELLEGLAVLTEYLIKGLDPTTNASVAARVIVAYERMRHTPFQKTFALLTEQYGFRLARLFSTVARIYQAGGFTKDLIYLRGFIQIGNIYSRGTV